MSPRVSLGLPVFDGERYLAEALDCALAQTCRDFEIVISDNASTDATEAICRDYAGRDPRIRYHRSPENRGAAWNFNHTLALARGAYFKWMAHDDRMAPTFLERCVSVLDEEPDVVLAYPRSAQIGEHGERIGPVEFELHGDAREPHERFRHQICVHHRCFHVFGLMRTEVLRRTRAIDTYVGSDRVLLAHLALLGRLHEVPEELFFQRQHPGRSTAAQPTLQGRAAWFDPTRAGARTFPHWRLGAEYFAAVGRTGLGAGERIRCRLQLVRWLAYVWRDLLADVRHTLDVPRGAMG